MRLDALQSNGIAMRRDIFACWTIALLTCGAFWGVLSNDFINFDDNSYVTQNRYVQAGLSADSIRAALTESFNGHWHPLTTLSYMADRTLYGPGPAGFHFTNMLLHVLNGILLFYLLRTMTGAFYRSLAVALLFAVHPLHVEPVAWIASRKDVLSTLFLFAALLFYTRYARRPSRFSMAAIFAAMLLGLLSKAMLVTLPVILLLLDYWPLARYEKDWGGGLRARLDRLWQLTREKWPLFGLSFFFAIVTVATQAGSGTMSRLDTLPLSARIVNAVQSYGMYVFKAIWPTGLAPFYPHSGDTSLGLAFWFGAFVIGVGTLLSLGLLRRAPYIAAGWTWYLVTLLPVSGIMQAGIQAYADRYTYVSLIGVFFAAVWGADALRRRVQAPAVLVRVGSCTVLLLLFVVTWLQVQRWENDETLFRHTLAVTKNNHVAHMILGNVYYEQGELDAAVEHYRAGLEIEPNDADIYAAMGLALSAQGKVDAAMSHYKAALNLNPDHVPARSKLASLLLSAGTLDHAIVQFEQTLARDPAHVVALNGLGLAQAGQGEYEKALESFQLGLDIDPANASLHADIALVLAQLGRDDEAFQYFQEAIVLDPDDADTHNNLAIMLAKRGEHTDAERHFRRALELNPHHESAKLNLKLCLQAQESTRNS